MLEIKDVSVRYGAVQVLKGIFLNMDKGSITALIGANGAGKSTCLRAVSGLIPLSSGEIRFFGKRIDNLRTEKIVQRGISMVPEGKRLFPEMSARDNILTGAFLRTGKKEIQRDLNRILEFFPFVARSSHRRASNFSGGEQQMIAIARALLARPRLLLLDEPSLGLSPIMTREVGRIIERIAGEGLSILLVEQKASLALKLAFRGYVLETGRIVLEGRTDELIDNDHVRRAYLGG